MAAGSAAAAVVAAAGTATEGFDAIPLRVRRSSFVVNLHSVRTALRVSDLGGLVSLSKAFTCTAGGVAGDLLAALRVFGAPANATLWHFFAFKKMQTDGAARVGDSIC